MQGVQRLVCVHGWGCRSFAPWSEFPQLPAEMERKGHGGGGPIRGAPTPPRAPLPSWGTCIMGTQRRGRESSTRANKVQARQRRAGALLRQSWGLGGKSIAKPPSGSLHRERLLVHCRWGETTNILLRKAAEHGDGGYGRRKEGKFPVMGLGQGRLSAVRGLDRMSRERVQQNYHLPKRSESMRT